MAGREIIIPYAPRPLQASLHRAVRGVRWAVVVCHRRWGKTVWAVNHLQAAALECAEPAPRFAYIAPTYRQGKAVAWDYMKHFAATIPGHKVNESELRVDYPHCGQVRIYGSDNPDALRGLYLDGAVFDEYGLQSPTIFSEVVRPALADRGGWAIFGGTPAGKNLFYDIAQVAQREDSWYYACHKASETGILNPDELAGARSVMTPDEYAQEFECSFEASVKGSIFGPAITAARDTGRVTRVPYDPMMPVHTAWDLGVGDATAIWFCQTVPGSGEVRLIDYYEASGEGLPHYAGVLAQRGYVYGRHWAPHDIQVRELSTGRSRLEAGHALGIHFAIVPNATGEELSSVEEGIHAARMLLPRCYFDAERCDAGLVALTHYRRDYNTRLNEFVARPVHDWASHGADAFRYLALSLRTPRVKDAEREQARAVSLAQRDHDPYDRRRQAALAGDARRRGGL